MKGYVDCIFMNWYVFHACAGAKQKHYVQYISEWYLFDTNTPVKKVIMISTRKKQSKARSMFNVGTATFREDDTRKGQSKGEKVKKKGKRGKRTTCQSFKIRNPLEISDF